MPSNLKLLTFLPVVFLKFAFKPMVSMIFYLKCLLEFLVVHSNPTPKKKQAVLLLLQQIWRNSA